MKQKKGIITIAIGKKYANQAKYLAYSCMLHVPHILRAVITDKPEMLSDYYDFVLPYHRDYSDPFMTKTRLPLYTPFEETLYMDADCLVINNIDSLWANLEEQPFVYEGALFENGEWYFDIAQIIRQLSIPWIPKFNSGMLLFNNSEKAKSIFDTAFYYFTHQKDTGIDVAFFRGTSYPDEPFLAISLAKHDAKPLEDYGRFAHAMMRASNIHLDVIKGFAFFAKSSGTPVFPLIVHFCGKFGQLLYFREKLRLFFCFNPPVYSLFVAVCTGIRNLVKKKSS
jgi:hypothetical protein